MVFTQIDKFQHKKISSSSQYCILHSVIQTTECFFQWRHKTRDYFCKRNPYRRTWWNGRISKSVQKNRFTQHKTNLLPLPTHGEKSGKCHNQTNVNSGQITCCHTTSPAGFSLRAFAHFPPRNISKHRSHCIYFCVNPADCPINNSLFIWNPTAPGEVVGLVQLSPQTPIK